MIADRGSRHDTDRHESPSIATPNCSGAWYAAGLAQRSCDPAHHRARHARGRQPLDHAAPPGSRRPSSTKSELDVQRPDGPGSGHRRGRRRRRFSRRTRSCSTRRSRAGRGSRSTIRCSKADTARRSTPSTAARAFPAASRSTSSRCRRCGALPRDPAARPADGNGFGADVLAVADGTIAAAVDDIVGSNTTAGLARERQRQLRRARPRRRALRVLRASAARQRRREDRGSASRAAR